MRRISYHISKSSECTTSIVHTTTLKWSLPNIYAFFLRIGSSRRQGRNFNLATSISYWILLKWFIRSMREKIVPHIAIITMVQSMRTIIFIMLYTIRSLYSFHIITNHKFYSSPNHLWRISSHHYVVHYTMDHLITHNNNHHTQVHHYHAHNPCMENWVTYVTVFSRPTAL